MSNTRESKVVERKDFTRIRMRQLAATLSLIGQRAIVGKDRLFLFLRVYREEARVLGGGGVNISGGNFVRFEIKPVVTWRKRYRAF